MQQAQAVLHPTPSHTPPVTTTPSHPPSLSPAQPSQLPLQPHPLLPTATTPLLPPVLQPTVQQTTGPPPSSQPSGQVQPSLLTSAALTVPSPFSVPSLHQASSVCLIHWVPPALPPPCQPAGHCLPPAVSNLRPGARSPASLPLPPAPPPPQPSCAAGHAGDSLHCLLQPTAGSFSL